MAVGARTLTLLFTDVEGSTKAVQQVGDARYAELLDEHLSLLRGTFLARGGHDAHTEGDALFFVFTSASDAVAAAIDAQRALASSELQTRIGIHTGEVLPVGEYFRGLAVHQAARVCGSAHGGQILVSGTTAALADATSLRATFDDLGSFRLKDVAEPLHLFQVHADGLRTSFPRPRTLDVSAHGLPTHTGPMVGRERQMREVRDLVLSQNVRLVTITGPGGMGKTRMAVHIAAEVAEDFADGSWFVDLVPARVVSHVESSILHALGAEDTTIEAFLANKELLLVLDNFEQVLDSTDVVAQILACAPRVKVLVTSRTRLHLRDETEYVMPPMGDDAPALFVHYATSVDPTFELTDESATVVDQVCDTLDRLPLAIELAATRSKLLSPAALAERLSTSLDVLESDRVDAPERQRTMRDTLQWSYDLLSPDEQRVFRWLSVFRGGFSVDAASAISGDSSLSTIASLVDHSLVRRSMSAEGAVRIGLLGTVRDFASEKLSESGERADAILAHATYHRDWARRAESALQGPDQAEWLNALERDVDDLRAVIYRARSGEVDQQIALELIGNLDRFWIIRAHAAEIRPALEELLERNPEPTRARALGLVFFALMIAPSIDWDLIEAEDARRAHPYLAEASSIAHALADDLVIAMTAFFEMRTRKRLKGRESKVSADEVQAAIASAERAGDETYATALKAYLRRGLWGGFVNGLQEVGGTYLFDERMRAASAKGDRATIAALQLRRAGAFPVFDEEKWRLANEALVTARSLGDKRQEGEALLTVGRLAKSGCLYEEARDAYLRSFELYTELGDAEKCRQVGGSLRGLAEAVGDTRAKKAYRAAVQTVESGPTRAGAVIGTMLRETARLGGAFLAASIWLRRPNLLTGALVAIVVWALSGSTRSLLLRVSSRLRNPGHLVMLPFTAFTLIFFFIGYATGRPAIGAALTLLVAALRCGRANARLMTPARRLAAPIGYAGVVIAVIAAATQNAAIGTIVEIVTVIFVAAFGWGARPAMLAEKIGQMGWFLMRFFIATGFVSIFAAYRHVPFGGWRVVSTWAIAVGLVFVAVSVLALEMRDRISAVVLIAGGTALALWAAGVIGWHPAAVLIGMAYVGFWMRPLVWPNPPMIEIPVVV